MGTVRIPLSSRKYSNLCALIDEEDYELVSQYRWHPQVRGHTTYARSNTGVSLHRLILGLSDPSLIGDHINHDGLDNRRSNLRVVSATENAWNSRPHSNSTSPYRGVAWDASISGWVVQQRIDGRSTFIGVFDDEVLAAHVADRTAIARYGAMAFLNFPDSLLPESELDAMIRRDRSERARRANEKKLGRPNMNRKLTPWQVAEIRRLYKKGVRGRGAPALASRFGVSVPTIQRIVGGEVWKGAEDEIRRS